MLFSREVNWSFFDFLVAAVLLYGTVFTISFILNTFKSKTQRLLLSVIIISAIILIWIELAVGIFGSPLAGS
ncbi:hypothetical protein [Neotamlana nanhaiensis]|nr:hypothetical protein [Tamlana nanhaiensis]